MAVLFLFILARGPQSPKLTPAAEAEPASSAPPAWASSATAWIDAHDNAHPDVLAA